MALLEKREKIVADMSVLPDRFERFQYIVDVGKSAPPLGDDEHTDTFRVEGCQSQLWLVPEQKDGCCFFRADSDSAIVKGIANLICQFYSGEPAEVIVGGDIGFLQEVGVDQHLSSNRRNGLGKVDERIKRFAQSVCDASNNA